MSKKHLLFVLVVLTIVSLLLSACGGAETIVPDAAPATKPPPASALTSYAGGDVSGFFGAAFWAILAGLAVVFAGPLGQVFLDRSDGEYRVRPKHVGWGLIFAVVIIGLLAVPNMAVTVPAGYEGVLLTFGRVEDRAMYPGLHWITPWAQRVAVISTREYTYITTSHVDDDPPPSEDFIDWPITARTCDGVEVDIPVTVKFRVAWPGIVYSNYGGVVEAMERVVKAATRTAAREAPTSFPAVILYTSAEVAGHPELIQDEILRQELENRPCGDLSAGFETVELAIREVLATRFSDAGLQLTEFDLRQPDLGPYGELLDARRNAAQQALVEETRVAVSTFLANQAIEVARGSAESDKIKTIAAAEAAKQEVILAAEGAAEATKLGADADRYRLEQEGLGEASKIGDIQQQLAESPAYLDYIRILAWQAGGAQVPNVVVGDDSGMVPIFTIPSE